MRKGLSVIAVLSMAVGAAGGYLYAHKTSTRQWVIEASTEPASRVARPEPENLESVLSANAQGTAVFELVARTDAASLPDLLTDALVLPESAAKSLLIQGVALRATELEGDRALEWIGSLPLDPRAAQTVGLALLDALGPSAENVEAVLAALPSLEARRFRVEALALWAETAPERAFQEALALGDWSMRTNAVARVASVWAERDLGSALVEADLLPDDNFGRAFRSAVVHTLSETNPAAMVAYVNGAAGRQLELARVVAEQIGLMEPEEALRWAEQLHGNVGQTARNTALRNWAQTSPLAAFAYAQAMPLGDERLNLINEVARGYGRQDPDGALAWARSLPATPVDVLGGVIAGIAEVDGRRALDLAFGAMPTGTSSSEVNRGRISMLIAIANNVVMSHEIPVPEIMSRVLSMSNPIERMNASNFVMQRWLSDNPDQAFEWIATAQDIPPDDAARLVTAFARNDPLRAATYTARVAPELRDMWIASVAQSYARLDAPAALTWLRQYRDEPAYSAALAAVALRVVELDTPQAAGLLAELPPGDPNAARAAGELGKRWAEQSPADAKLWAAQLPQGPLRDAALSGIIGAAYRESVPEESLLRLFSSEESRQRAVATTIYTIGKTDRDAARRIADEHITLPAVRNDIDRWLERPEQGNLVVYPGGFVIRQ